MAQPDNADPITAIIDDGRIRVRPIDHYGLPDVITVNLEQLAGFVTSNLTAAYTNCLQIRNRYTGSPNQITHAIISDTTMLVNFAIAQTYNRLRSVLERRAPSICAARMNRRAPVANQQEFPHFISSTLGSIGPFRVEDGPTDRYVVYASTAATQNKYGRDAGTVFNEGQYCKITSVLRECNFRLTPFPSAQAEGSYFPTLTSILESGLYRVFGAVHSSHYENEDVMKIALCTNDLRATPFDPVGMTFGYVDNEAAVTALAAVPVPDGIPAGQNYESAGRPVGIEFNINYCGVQPIVAAQGAVPARTAGFYIVGRGTTRYYQCSLADQVSVSEIYDCLRYRLLR